MSLPPDRVPPRTLPWLFLALAACGSKGDDTAAADVYTPAPYLVDEEDPPVATFSADAVGEAIISAMIAGPALNAAPVFPAYLAVMDGQDGSCPNYYSYNGNAYWYDTCTSESGVSYSGYSFYYSYVDYESDGVIYNGDQLFGVATVTDADGDTFQAGGSAAALSGTAVDGSYTLWQSVVQGSFAYDGAAGRGTWLEDHLAPDLTLAAYYVPSYDARAMILDGGVSGLGGDFDTVVFSNVALYDIAGGCRQEPSGLISLRDGEGNWYDVTLDGPVDFGGDFDAAACDGCGDVWFRGEDVGQVCVDFTTLTSWGSEPW